MVKDNQCIYIFASIGIASYDKKQVATELSSKTQLQKRNRAVSKCNYGVKQWMNEHSRNKEILTFNFTFEIERPITKNNAKIH